MTTIRPTRSARCRRPRSGRRRSAAGCHRRPSLRRSRCIRRWPMLLADRDRSFRPVEFERSQRTSHRLRHTELQSTVGDRQIEPFGGATTQFDKRHAAPHDRRRWTIPARTVGRPDRSRPRRSAVGSTERRRFSAWLIHRPARDAAAPLPDRASDRRDRCALLSPWPTVACGGTSGWN